MGKSLLCCIFSLFVCCFRFICFWIVGSATKKSVSVISFYFQSDSGQSVLANEPASLKEAKQSKQLISSVISAYLESRRSLKSRSKNAL